MTAFRSTLEELIEADVWLQLVDITHPNALEQAQVVEDVLKEIGATKAPILTVLNKIDAFDEDSTVLQEQLTAYDNSIPISAKTGQGLEGLLKHIETMIEHRMIPIQVCLPYSAGHLTALLHEQGVIESKTSDEAGIHFTARIPKHLVDKFDRYQKSEA